MQMNPASKMKRMGHILLAGPTGKAIAAGVRMLSNLDVSWFFFAVVTVAIFAFMLGMALDGVMGDDGFGATGNMVVITAGFFLAIFAANNWGIHFADLKIAIGTGLGGAFIAVFCLALMKAGIERLFSY
jgi:hypothetical protein